MLGYGRGPAKTLLKGQTHQRAGHGMMATYPSMDVFQQRSPLSNEDASLQDVVMTPAVHITVNHPIRLGTSHEASSLYLTGWASPINKPF